MTRLKFIQDKSGNLLAFRMQGHAEYANENDIVCAALSACVQLFEQSVVELLGEEKGSFTADEKTTEISYSMPEMDEEKKKVFYLLISSFYKYVTRLQKQYKKNIYCETEVKPC